MKNNELGNVNFANTAQVDGVMGKVAVLKI